MTINQVVKHPLKFLAAVRDTFGFKAERVGMRFRREIELERRLFDLTAENRKLREANLSHVRVKVRAKLKEIRERKKARGGSGEPCGHCEAPNLHSEWIPDSEYGEEY